MRLILLYWAALVPLINFAQEIKYVEVHGTITNMDGEPLPQVSVFSKNQFQAVISDINGNYSILLTPNEYLKFTYAGYEEYSVMIKNSGTLQVSLEPRKQTNVTDIFLDNAYFNEPVFIKKSIKEPLKIWSRVEIDASYRGNFSIYLKNSLLKLLELKKTKLTPGAFTARILIDPLGGVTFDKLLMGIEPKTDSMLITAIKNSSWQPAMQNGLKIKSVLNIKINLQEENKSRNNMEKSATATNISALKNCTSFKRSMDTLALPKDATGLLIKQLIDTLDFSQIIMDEFQMMAFGKTETDAGYKILMDKQIGRNTPKYRALYNLLGNKLRLLYNLQELKELVSLRNTTAGKKSRFLESLLFKEFFFNTDYFLK